MDKNLYDQITNLLNKSQRILILTHARADCDGLGAALSAYLVFKELGKDVVVATNDPAPENLTFLPAIDILNNSLSGVRDFVITLDISKATIGKIKYNIEGSKVNIIITPKNGFFTESDVSCGAGETRFDLIFVFDAGNLEHLGPLYDQNVEMFFNTPVINMDHHASNTDFGKVNVVDVTASSATEILFDYLQDLEKKYNKKLITEDVATLLLAGIITDTGSFQHANTSPRAMESSAKLLDLGARQQEIIKNIYKTKKLSTLKLWGIILSKVQVDPVHRMVWSTISKDDLQEAEADPDETEGIIDDLLTNAPGAEVIFLIKQAPDCISVSMRSTNSQTDVGKFCSDNGGGGHVRAAGFKLRTNEPFDMVVSDVVGKVRKFQAERLNIHEGNGGGDGGGLVTTTMSPQSEAEPQQNHNRTTTEPREAGPHNVPTMSPQLSTAQAPATPPKSSKVTYLDFNAPKPAVQAEQGLGGSSEPAAKPAEVQAVSDKISAPDEQLKPKKKRRRRHKNKKQPIQQSQQASVAGSPVTLPQPNHEEPPNAETSPPAPYVEPV